MVRWEASISKLSGGAIWWLSDDPYRAILVALRIDHFYLCAALTCDFVCIFMFCVKKCLCVIHMLVSPPPQKILVSIIYSCQLIHPKKEIWLLQNASRLCTECARSLLSLYQDFVTSISQLCKNYVWME